MYMKKFLTVLSISAVLSLVGCSTVQEIMVSGESVINTAEELYQQVENSLKEGKEEVTFITEELSQDDLNVLNQEHDGFYGSVPSMRSRP